jgi:hypothetical protein
LKPDRHITRLVVLLIALAVAASWAGAAGAAVLPEDSQVGAAPALTLGALRASWNQPLLPAVLAAAPDPLLLAQAQPETDEPVDVYGFQKKSPRRAFLQSFLIPGWGQWYNGSRWKPFLFLGLEAAGWYGVAHFNGSGNDKETEYEVYADEHWDSTKYFDGLEEVFYSNVSLPSDYDRRKLDCRTYSYINQDNELQEMTFSHHAFIKDTVGPVTVPHDEFYENIGKYDQFNFGWDDYPAIANTDSFPTGPTDTARLGYVSPHRHTYLGMRDDANKEFKRASTVLIATICNHLLSAFEAAIGARRFNRAQDQFGAVETRVRLVTGPDGGFIRPRVTVAYRF